MATFFTPGPSEPYPKLRSYLNDAIAQNIVSESHRSSAFKGIYQQTDAALRAIMHIPKEYQIVFMGSATEAMERVLQGVIKKRSHHFVYGAFSEKWFEIAQQLGKQPTAIKIAPGSHFKRSDLTVPEDTELICITQNETSVGATFPLSELQHVIEQAPKSLVAVDIVSSAPLVTVPWEKLDLVFFSVQKAFGLPAGLGVLILSPRAIKKARSLQKAGQSIGSYHSLVSLAEQAEESQTPATPNVLGIYLLGRVAQDMQQIGITNIINENRRRAELLYSTVDNSNYLESFIVIPEWRSTTVVVINIRGGNKLLHDQLFAHELLPGQGYGSFKEDHLRIANFPSIDVQAFMTLIEHLSGYHA
jgi:phosphoserine aminotransferase